MTSSFQCRKHAQWCDVWVCEGKTFTPKPRAWAGPTARHHSFFQKLVLQSNVIRYTLLPKLVWNGINCGCTIKYYCLLFFYKLIYHRLIIWYVHAKRAFHFWRQFRAAVFSRCLQRKKNWYDMMVNLMKSSINSSLIRHISIWYVRNGKNDILVLLLS